MPFAEPEYFKYLSELDCKDIKVYSIQAGTLVFPREPLLRVSGPIGLVQLLETTILNLLNYPTLMATNAARFRIVAGRDKNLLEFGLRRAQGPAGGIIASKYAVLGSFDSILYIYIYIYIGTSNVLAGEYYGIPTVGTMAHSYVLSYTDSTDLGTHKFLENEDLLALCLQFQKELNWTETNYSELLSFVGYATSYPTNFLALIDTYNTLLSGVRNFLIVALALDKLNYKAKGIRLDSGDLAELSKRVREIFTSVGEKYKKEYFSKFLIAASNDIHEGSLHKFNAEGHSMDIFGVGTNLVTCLKQPALGMVYKLVDICGEPRIKFSEEMEKTTLPGAKVVFRVYVVDLHNPTLDIMALEEEIGDMVVGDSLLCYSPFALEPQTTIIPKKMELITTLIFDGGVKVGADVPLMESRQFVLNQIDSFPNKVTDCLEPTKYPVYVTQKLNLITRNLVEKNKMGGQ